jgi:DNA-binding CsgD family transcriptional regulator
MSITTADTAPIPGLLSLVADSVESDQTGTTTTGPAVSIETPGLPAALGALVGAWMAVKDDGQGWMLLQFAASTDASPKDGARTPLNNAPAVEPRPLPTRPDFAARARRVHTALTEREREVLCLVAGGATNCAIAARLFISPKTASVHVSRILAKLNASTRTEAAALAHASGLVQPWATTSGSAGLVASA